MATSGFLDNAYQVILNRPPTPSEAAAPQSDSVTDREIAQAIAVSEAALAEPATIIRFYEAAFGRKPDAAGFDYWTNLLRNDPTVSTASVAKLFAGSQEFLGRFGLSGSVDRAALVDSFYDHVLAREADAAGRKFWIDSSFTPEQLLLLFSQSQEFVRRAAPEITEFYLDIALSKSADISNTDIDDYLGSIFDVPKPPAPPPAVDPGPAGPSGNPNSHVLVTKVGGAQEYIGDGLPLPVGDQSRIGDAFSDLQDLAKAIEAGYPRIELLSGFASEKGGTFNVTSDLKLTAAPDVETSKIVLQLAGTADTMTLSADSADGFGYTTENLQPGLIGRDQVAGREPVVLVGRSETPFPLAELDLTQVGRIISVPGDHNSGVLEANFLGKNKSYENIFSVENGTDKSINISYVFEIKDITIKFFGSIEISAHQSIILNVGIFPYGVLIRDDDGSALANPFTYRLQGNIDGNDIIIGGSGPDVIQGGTDSGILPFNYLPVNTTDEESPYAVDSIRTKVGDKLTGGDGADTFYHRAGDGVDLITDFVPGVDKIKLSDNLIPYTSSYNVRVKEYDYDPLDSKMDTIVTFVGLGFATDSAIILLGVDPTTPLGVLMGWNS